jgi:hypothetical protein
MTVIENKLSIYFIYAIGEVLIVIIGIIIAIQSNNWTPQRLAEIKINRLLLEIQNNLEDKIESARIGIEYDNEKDSKKFETLIRGNGYNYTLPSSFVNTGTNEWDADKWNFIRGYASEYEGTERILYSIEHSDYVGFTFSGLELEKWKDRNYYKTTGGRFINGPPSYSDSDDRATVFINDFLIIGLHFFYFFFKVIQKTKM